MPGFWETALLVSFLLAYFGFGSEEIGAHILGSNHRQRDTPGVLWSLCVTVCVLITAFVVLQSLVQSAGPPFLSCEHPLRNTSLSSLALVSLCVVPTWG